MPDEFGNVTDPLSGVPSADAGTPANPLEEENRRLKQKLAQNENMLQQARPLVDLTQKLWNAPGGKDIIRRLQSNLPLTADQEATVAAAAPAGVTEDKVREIVADGNRDLEHRIWETGKAERAMADLHARASKELGEGYDNIAGSQQWNQALGVVVNMMTPKRDPQTGEIVEEPAIKVPETEDDPYYYAVKYTYGYLTGAPPTTETNGDSPKPNESSENRRRAAIAAQSSKPAGAPAGEQDEHADNPDLQWARSRGSATIGKSFANS